MKIHKTCTAIIVVCCMFSTVQGQDGLTRAFTKAVEENAELHAIYNQWQSATVRAGSADALPDPSIMVSYFLQPVETRLGPQRASFSLNQSIPGFGKRKADLAHAESLITIYERKWERRASEIWKEMQLIYWNYNLQEFEKTAWQETIEWLQEIKEIAEVNFVNGKGSQVEILKIEMEQLKVENQLAKIIDLQEAELSDWRSYFTQWGEGIPLEDLTIYTGEEFFPFTEYVPSNTNVELAELEAITISKEAELERLSMNRRPNLSIGISYSLIDERIDSQPPGNGRDAFIFPQLGFSIPLSRTKYANDEMGKKHEITSLQNQQLDVGRKLKSEMEVFHKQFQISKRTEEMYASLLVLNEQALQLMMLEYELGNRGFDDLLEMEKQLLTFRLEHKKEQITQSKIVTQARWLHSTEFTFNNQ